MRIRPWILPARRRFHALPGAEEPSAVHPLETDCRTVKSQLDAGADFLLLDCREESEHQLVHIPQAKLLPMSQVMARADELAPFKEKPVVVHCHHGGRSLRVATWLKQQGFADVKSLAGGIDQWAVEIDPTLPRY